MTQRDNSGDVSVERVDQLRRRLVKTVGVLGGESLFAGRIGGALAAEEVMLPFANGRRALVAYPQKRPLILMTSRPVQLETPMAVFDEGPITANDAFFVRWHLADMPITLDATKFTLKVHGRVKTPLALRRADLQKDFEPVEITAVCQCSGNSRGFFAPRVAGGQWANGAMGNAVWKGARLKDILDKAGLEADAVQVRLNGAEGPVAPGTPDFIKAIDVDLARHPDVIVAYAMNGQDLPLLNGFPFRLIVPGYFATYWVKMLDDIEVIDKVDSNFWMNPAYRIPADPSGSQKPGETVKTVPINRMPVRSFITSVADGAKVAAGQALAVRGIAFDSGYGIQRVLFSSDGGANWTEARLGKDLGKYSFRQWEASITPAAGKSYALQSLAINGIGESQRVGTAVWNPGGYLRNTVETVRVSAG
jgi:DMSO/TMAO reductase YedYZ molybdopterin-dependent catalytic subunit